MLIIHNPEEWKTVTTQETCAYHKKHPGVNWAGCTCFGSISQVRKTEEEMTDEDKAIKAARGRFEQCP